MLILIFAAGALGYFLVQAPVWCGAMAREGADVPQQLHEPAPGLPPARALRDHITVRPLFVSIRRLPLGHCLRGPWPDIKHMVIPPGFDDLDRLACGYARNRPARL